MADFVNIAGTIQSPDILGSYLRGQVGAQQVEAGQQQLVEGGLNIDQLRLAIQNQQMLQGAARSLLGGRTTGSIPTRQDTSAIPPPGTTPNTQYPPQDLGATPQTPGVQAGYQPSDYNIPSVSTPALDPGTMAAVGMLGGDKLLKGIQDNQRIQEEQRQSKIKDAQMKAAAPLNVFDAISNSPAPVRMLMNNPSIMALWPRVAQSMGLDPVKDLTDENVARAAIFGGNQLRATVGLPLRELPTPVKTTQLADGSIIQTKPLTGEVTEPVKADLKPVIGPNGQPILLPSSQAAGHEPYNASIFGAANMSDQAVQMAADYVRGHQGQMPMGFSRSPAIVAKVWAKVASDSAASGDTMGAITARGAALKANGQALDQVTKLESATTAYYGTLDKNLNALTQLSGKVDSSGVPILNRVYRAWQQGVTGDPDIAKYVTYLNAVEGEYAKIQSGSLGNAPTSDASKRDAKDVINKFMSQGQIQAVADAMRGEGNNRLSSIRDQKQSLLDQMGQGAPSASAPAVPSTQRASLPTKNAQGWVLHTDAKGNKAYVSPDGRQYQEVK